MSGNKIGDAYQCGLPFVVGSDTSEAAAKSLKESASTLRAKVLRYVKECGDLGATCDEVEVALDMRHQTASARMRELAMKDFIRDAQVRRKTRSGRTAAVWVAA